MGKQGPNLQNIPPRSTEDGRKLRATLCPRPPKLTADYRAVEIRLAARMAKEQERAAEGEGGRDGRPDSHGRGGDR